MLSSAPASPSIGTVESPQPLRSFPGNQKGALCAYGNIDGFTAALPDPFSRPGLDLRIVADLFPGYPLQFPMVTFQTSHRPGFPWAAEL
jgi:hypothetical protein